MICAVMADIMFKKYALQAFLWVVSSQCSCKNIREHKLTAQCIELKRLCVARQAHQYIAKAVKKTLPAIRTTLIDI